MSAKFPSGSYWGVKEIKMVRFSTEPKKQGFQNFDCGGTLSGENRQVLSRLSNVLAVPVESLKETAATDPLMHHRPFYRQLYLVLQPTRTQDAPSKHLTRSSIRQNSSSPFTDQGQPTSPTAVPPDFGSPDSSPAAGGTKRKIRVQSTTPPPNNSRAISTSPQGMITKPPPESEPSQVNQEDSSTKDSPSPSKVTGQSYPTSDDGETPNASHHTGQAISSSEGSEFQLPSSPSALTESASESNADVLEDEVNLMFMLFLTFICEEHGKLDDIEFSTQSSHNLNLVIDGETVHTRPDRTIYVSFGGRPEIAIFDYEVCNTVLIG